MKKVKFIVPSAFILILIVFLAILITIKLKNNNRIAINYPFEEALFPPEFPAPTFEWSTNEQYSGMWEVSLATSNKRFKIVNKSIQTKWTPEKSQWDSLKILSNHKNIKFTVKRTDGNFTKDISIQISSDTVGAPVLYRQIPIPFIYAEKNLDSMNYRLINFGSDEPPHFAMKGFPVCGNCHSFTQDGKTIGLDLDAGRRDKGGYFVAPINDSIVFDINDYMSWTKIEKRRTFGMFSKLSPDGRYIVTTVKDRVLSKNFPYEAQYIPFSQLFFVVNGHLAVYNRLKHQLKELPGANLDEYVQTNATWSPDGKYIIFARAKALPLSKDPLEINIHDEKLIEEFVERKRTFKYDICIIPFNNGNGGKAELIKGASDNGKSNYFPAVSPNGKWLMYCEADNFMLLQPDSRLYIVPLKGGKAKELGCNMPLMNSWHAWSPNSKWVVFSSKGLSIYTDLFLSHIDEGGNASVPVLVDKARQYRRVVNYPEFLNRKPDRAFNMDYDYVELAHIERAVMGNDMKKAKLLYHEFVEQNQLLFSEDYYQLSKLLQKMGLNEDAKKYEKLSRNQSGK